jgi:iron(III) transport system ATP-binding protein
MTAVEFQSVSKRYGHAAAVDDVSFTIERATLVTLLGPSGCGKTTTLRLIAGLEHASSGRILIGGRDVTALSAAERDVSMVFQSYALFPHMTVMENVCYGLLASGYDRRRAEPVAAEKLRLLGLSGFERRLPSELSGGQQQRVAVARAIVLEPEVLLFDEPLSNLDARLRRRVRDEIRALQQELALTVVYVTHDQQEALAVSDRVIVMNAGGIAQDGTPRSLYATPANRFIADFIGEANIVPVTVRRMDDSRAEVTLGALRLVMPHASLADGGMADGAALLAIRPHAIRLSATASTGGLAGSVAKAAYLGSHMEYDVEIDGQETRLFVVAGDVDAPLAVGTRIRASMDPAGLALIPAD